MSELSVRLSPDDVRAIAVELADELERRGIHPGVNGPALVSLDELVELLPPGRSWKRWLYEHAPRGDVAGAVQLGRRWYFRRDETLAALGVTSRDEGAVS